ncbi:hypothetical protein FQN54_001762 [Arachnomyces sp. PD_36]|nr:hypothetical protein FQN54_001762 [Arachnomyces sp. PD_36]
MCYYLENLPPCHCSHRELSSLCRHGSYSASLTPQPCGKVMASPSSALRTCVACEASVPPLSADALFDHTDPRIWAEVDRIIEIYKLDWKFPDAFAGSRVAFAPKPNPKPNKRPNPKPKPKPKSRPNAAVPPRVRKPATAAAAAAAAPRPGQLKRPGPGNNPLNLIPDVGNIIPSNIPPTSQTMGIAGALKRKLLHEQPHHSGSGAVLPQATTSNGKLPKQLHSDSGVKRQRQRHADSPHLAQGGSHPQQPQKRQRQSHHQPDALHPTNGTPIINAQQSALKRTANPPPQKRQKKAHHPVNMPLSLPSPTPSTTTTTFSPSSTPTLTTASKTYTTDPTTITTQTTQTAQPPPPALTARHQAAAARLTRKALLAKNRAEAYPQPAPAPARIPSLLPSLPPLNTTDLDSYFNSTSTLTPAPAVPTTTTSPSPSQSLPQFVRALPDGSVAGLGR